MSTGEPSRVAERRRVEGLIALLFVQLFFGLAGLFAKLALAGGTGYAPRAVVVWRIGTGALVLGGLAILRHGRAVLVGRAAFLRLLWLAPLGVAVNQFLFIEGISRSSVMDAGLIVTTIPVFTCAVAALVGVERLSPRRGAGIACSMAGALLLVLLRTGDGESLLASEHLHGNLMMIANCFLYAVFLVGAKKLLTRLHSLVVIAWVFVLSAAALPWMGSGISLGAAEPTRATLVGLVCMLLFPTVLAYLFNTFALARVGATTTAAFIYLQPAVAFVAAMIWLDERLERGALVAGLLLFLGIALVVFAPPQRAPTSG